MTRLHHSPAIVFFTVALLLGPLVGPVEAEEAVSFFAQAKLTAADGASFDMFGVSVALDGDTVVAGALGDADLGEASGSAYVFERHYGGPDAWGQVTKLTADDGESFETFGNSAALDGDTVVIGAPFDDDQGSRSGSAYIFQRDFGGPDAWGQVAKLIADDGESGDRFGVSVTLDGDTVVVGAERNDSSGSAYVFQRDFGGPDAWGQVAKLTADDGERGDRFGVSVTLDGDTVVVGAERNDNSGSAYVFQRDFGGPDAWGQVAKLTADDGESGDHFGHSVALAGDTVVVGAYFDDDLGPHSGSAYVFQRDFGGPDAWGQVVKLTVVDGADLDWFGFSVAVAGDTAVIGVRQDGDQGSRFGSAYVFQRDFGGPNAWSQVAKLTAADGADSDWFGHSVAVAGDTVVVGAWGDDDLGESSGSAYMFREILVDPILELAGTCPGEAMLTASGVTPRGPIRLWGGLTEGTSTVSSGPCIGTELGLENATSLLSGRADANGGKSTIRNIPESRCGTFLQLLDETSCSTGDVVQLPKALLRAEWRRWAIDARLGGSR